MLVAGEKSSLLISIVFRKTVEEETISFPGFENRFFVLFLRFSLSPPSPGLLFLLLHNSYGLRGRPEPAAQKTRGQGNRRRVFSLWLCG